MLDGNITGNTTFANNINLTVGDGDSTTTAGEQLKITGAMTVNGMTLNLDIFDTGNYDTINVTGVASFGGALTVNLNTAVYPENTTFDLISSDTSLTIDPSVISAALSSGQTGTFSLVDGKTLRFTMGPEPPKPVPEPSTWALLILGFAGQMWLRRKHERR